MSPNSFDQIEGELRSGGAAAVFELLIRQFRAEKKYPQLLETRLMQKRHELGLPLVQLQTALADLPEAARPAYEKAFVEGARETGSLFLEDGDIARAWPYFRAIGDTAPVAAAIEGVEPGEGVEQIVEIAFGEGVHPRKGFELILAQYGMCRAITCFSQFPAGPGRPESLELLVRTLHAELLAALRRAVVRAEGSEPAGGSISGLIEGRDWLFADNAYYIDSSHVASVVQYSIELEQPETLELAVELTDYGRRLAPMFQFRGEPPFEDIYLDHGVYLHALLGRDVERAIVHFRAKAAAAEAGDSAPAQALVSLLARLGRYAEAIELSLEHLAGVPPGRLACPTVPQLCQMAGEYRRLMSLARHQDDLLSFAAAALQSGSSAAGG